MKELYSGLVVAAVIVWVLGYDVTLALKALLVVVGVVAAYPIIKWALSKIPEIACSFFPRPIG